MKFHALIPAPIGLLFLGTAFLFLFLLSGCTDEIVTNVIYERSSLTDPAIMPEVIFTSPAPHATGPFDELFNGGEGYYSPHFIIQFNNLIEDGIIVLPIGEGRSDSPAISGAISIEGFDEPTVVRLLTSYGSPGYSDIFAFRVNAENEYYSSIQYLPGRSYTVTVDTSLEDINGNHLVAPYRFSFTPEPFFRVVGSFPRNGVTDLSVTSSSLHVSFNSKITPSLLSLIQVDPPIQGTWQIDADSSRAFIVPYTFFEFNTSYSVTVGQDAEDTFGNQLAEAFHSSFGTAPFEVSFSYPQDGDVDIPPTASMILEFTGPVDTATIRSAFTVVPDVAWTFSYYYGGGDRFVFHPSTAFRASTTYQVTVSPEVAAWNGTRFSAPATMSFTTEEFKVTNVFPGDGNKDIPRGSSITVSCNAPLDFSTVSTAFGVSPPVFGSLSNYPFGTSFTFTPSSILNRYQLYTVTVNTSLKTANGDVLENPYSFSFLTGP